jgi:hypothetical protein
LIDYLPTFFRLFDRLFTDFFDRRFVRIFQPILRLLVIYHSIVTKTTMFNLKIKLKLFSMAKVNSWFSKVDQLGRKSWQRRSVDSAKSISRSGDGSRCRRGRMSGREMSVSASSPMPPEPGSAKLTTKLYKIIWSCLHTLPIIFKKNARKYTHLIATSEYHPTFYSRRRYKLEELCRICPRNIWFLIFLWKNRLPPSVGGQSVAKSHFHGKKRLQRRRMQGCQIFLGTWYQNRKKCTKWTQNEPNGHKISKMSVNIPNGNKINQHFPI